MTPEEIRAKHAEHIAKIQDLRRQIKHVQVDLEHLGLECEHPDKYDHPDVRTYQRYVKASESGSWARYNAMGRDPGGARCPDCGKSW